MMSLATKLHKFYSKRKTSHLYVPSNGPFKPQRRKHCKKCSVSSFPTIECSTIWEELRVGNQLCDGVVRCDDGIQFNIHRIILSTVSPYFRALFTNSVNRAQPEIHEANVDVSGGAFQVVLDYAYTGSCTIDRSNVFEVLKYADQYEILDVVHKCCEFLIKDLSPGNCLQIIRFASQFFCNYLTNKGYVYILQNFSNVLEVNEEFCQLSVDHLKQILSDDYLNVKSEEIVFDAIKKWTKHNPQNRKGHLLDLVKCIRMGVLSPDKILKMARWPLIEVDARCTMYVVDVLTAMEVKLVRTYLFRPRIPYDVVFAFGGWSAGSPISCVETYDNRADRWSIFKDADVVARAYHGMCSYEGKIYLIGGYNGNKYFNTMRCFDPVTHTWSDCACMYYSRCYVSVVTCQGKIYSMGGYNGRIRMKSAERFDPERNRWELIPSMQKQRSDAGAAVLNNKIYIVGGFNGQEVMNSAEMFDPATNEWCYIPSMVSPRSGVSLIAHRHALYAIGGYNGHNRLRSIEKFEPESSSWIEISEMMTPRSNFGSVILDDYIYVIGGFNGSTTIKDVECVDIERSGWVPAAPMNLNRSALSACVISGLPNSKDYSYLDRGQKQLNEDAKDDV